jgi:hypothetical protein
MHLMMSKARNYLRLVLLDSFVYNMLRSLLLLWAQTTEDGFDHNPDKQDDQHDKGS